MIDLAPNNPYALTISSPIIAAAGSVGYGVEVARHLGLVQIPGSSHRVMDTSRPCGFGSREPGSGGRPPEPGSRILGTEAIITPDRNFRDSVPATHGLGALVTRSTSLRPYKARPLPEIIETPAGLLYRGEAHNPGLRVVRERFAPIWATWDLPVVVSLWGESVADLAEAAALLEGVEGVMGIELPLAAHGALTPEAAGRLVAALRRATMLPLIVKLPGHAPDILALARAAVAHGADTLALIDSLPAVAPLPDGTLAEGRLCGPAIAPLALALVSAVCAEVTVPVIGIGGVRTSADARAMLAAGATAVGMGSALLADLRAGSRIAAG